MNAHKSYSSHCWHCLAGTPVEEPRAIAMVHACLDKLGINFFDTANVYQGYDRVRSETEVSEGKVAENILVRDS